MGVSRTYQGDREISGAVDRVSSQQCPILIVDDDDDQRSAVRDVLVERGYPVIEAPNGRIALDYLLGSRPQPGLILLDLNVPAMSGWELLTIIQSYLRLSRIPIVVLASDPGQVDTPSANVVGRLTKPFLVERLLGFAKTYAKVAARPDQPDD